MNRGDELIAIERTRQIRQEGYLPAHDDEHVNQELAQAARCYVAVALDPDLVPRIFSQELGIGVYWPWEPDWFKPSLKEEPGVVDRVRCLVKAGALFLAEAERRERLDQVAGVALARFAAKGCGREISALLRIR